MKNDKNKQEEKIEGEKETKVTEKTKASELEDLLQKVDECELGYKRALADYQNLQKRVNEEKSEWIRASNKDLLLRLLPVLDTLMMAGNHLQDLPSGKAGQGLTVSSDLIGVSINHFLDTLKAEGVTRIKTVGEEFNPHLMECVTTEKGEENKVLEELRVGYMLYDKVLRPAQVKVGKGS